MKVVEEERKGEAEVTMQLYQHHHRHSPMSSVAHTNGKIVVLLRAHVLETLKM